MIKKEKAALVMLSFFQIQTTLKFSHWRTKSYATHKALDKFLKHFLKKMDEFIEVWQGKYGRIEFMEKNGNSNKEMRVYQIGYDNLERYLDVLVGFLSGEKDKNCKKYEVLAKRDYCGINVMDVIDKGDYDLMNIRDEILADVNQLKYLLTLK